jgi:hypothetical protein
MGRWCGATLLGKQTKKYTIICAYQVPLVTGTSGPSTSHTQQMLMLKLADKVNQRPHHHLCKDLTYLLQEHIKEDCKIILMGDFSDELGSSLRGITPVVTDCNLVDVYAARHGLEDKVPTYARGRKRLDYILMTPTIASYATRSGADPF